MALRRRKDNNKEDTELLDDQEQEELIAALENQAQKQSQRTRSVVTLLGSVLSIIYMLLALHQTIWPWTVRVHAPFQNILQPVAIIAAHTGTAISIILSSGAVLLSQSGGQEHWQNALRLSGTLVMFISTFWGAALYRVARQTQGLDVIGGLLWLLITPMLYLGFMAALVRMLASTRPELARLRAYRYRHKKA